MNTILNIRVFMVTAIVLTGCPYLDSEITSQPTSLDYRQLMREFVEGISTYARNKNPIMAAADRILIR